LAKKTLGVLKGECYKNCQFNGGGDELARQMGTSVAMLEQHYSKITPELLAYEFANRARRDARKEQGS
jgi:hypothetical protein